MGTDDRDEKEDPAEELRQGLNHLWKAARGVATSVKKEVERTDFGKELSGAGREIVRATANVVDRIAEEVQSVTSPKPPAAKQEPPPPPPRAPGGDDDDEFDGVKPKPKGPTAQDPGFRIAVDDKKKE